MAASLPMTWAETWVRTSGRTGLTLPGMIEEPFCSSGSMISPSPARGPDPIQRMSLAILVQLTATTLRAPESSTRASRAARARDEGAGGGLTREGGGGRGEGEPGRGGDALADPGGQLGVGVQPCPDGGPAERELPNPAERRPDPLDPLVDLGGVAGELLAEGDRDGVHEMGAAWLDQVGEDDGLGRQRAAELLQGGQQGAGGGLEGGQVDR